MLNAVEIRDLPKSKTALSAAPFDACKDLLDVEAAVHNCKYDVCSCFDASCACHAIKSFVMECTEKGVTTLGSWRDHASFCREFRLCLVFFFSLSSVFSYFRDGKKLIFMLVT